MIEAEHDAALRALFVAAKMQVGIVNDVYDFAFSRLVGYCIMPAASAPLISRDTELLCWRKADRMLGMLRFGDMGDIPMAIGRVDRGLGAFHA